MTRGLTAISAKDLGKLALPEFCQRCFWLERHFGKPPSLFPGIFSTLDAVTRRSVHREFLKKGAAPGWFPFDDVEEVVEADLLFKLPVESGNWVLVGRPDDIFKLKDGSYHIVDYKTAKFTGRQDELFPMYEIQLNAYGYLAEKYRFRPVTKLSLIYCQPNEDLDHNANFKLSFSPHHLKVDLKPEKVKQLLVEARDIVNQQEPPESKFSCKGICQWLKSASNSNIGFKNHGLHL